MSQFLDDQSMFLLGIILILFLTVALIMYLLTSIGMYKMGKKAGIPLSGLAFVPVANQYVLGALLKGNFTVFGFKIEKPEYVLPIMSIISCVLSGVPIIGVLVGIIACVFGMFSIYHLYRKYKGDNATILTIVTLLFFIIYPFMIFGMRNADPVDNSYDSNDGEDNYGM